MDQEKSKISPKPELSIVVPVFNESECVERVYACIAWVMDAMTLTAELIFVDDGSQDRTADILFRVAAEDRRVRVVRLRRNFGQTAALRAGFDHARGDIIVSMDGDGQNDPDDIPGMIAKLQEGYDVVSGWRKDRKDSLFSRRIPSKLGNALIRLLTGVQLQDFGCTLRAYRRDIIQELSLYGEMHRMIPVLCRMLGASIAELEVKHHPRPAGKSKYTLWRALNVILDLITLKFFLGYFTRPLHIFGLLGLISIFSGIVAFGVTIWMKFEQHFNMTGNPFLSLGVLGVIIGTQLVMLGLLGEVTIRTYFESQKKTIYVVKEIRENLS